MHVRALLIVLVGLGLIVGLGVLLWWCLNPRFLLRVVNDTEVPLIDVHLAYPGGTRWVERILPGEEALWDIRPSGHAPLILSYRDPRGLLVACRTEIDLDGGECRDVQLLVRPAGVRVVHRSDVESP